MKTIDKWSWGVVVLAIVVITMWLVPPCHAASAPLISVNRLSVGIGGDFTAYRPVLLLDQRSSEFRATLVASYNLGNYCSLTGRAARGFDSQQKEYSVGFVVHLLARGKTP